MSIESRGSCHTTEALDCWCSCSTPHFCKPKFVPTLTATTALCRYGLAPEQGSQLANREPVGLPVRGRDAKLSAHCSPLASRSSRTGRCHTKVLRTWRKLEPWLCVRPLPRRA